MTLGESIQIVLNEIHELWSGVVRIEMNDTFERRLLGVIKNYVIISESIKNYLSMNSLMNKWVNSTIFFQECNYLLLFLNWTCD